MAPSLAPRLAYGPQTTTRGRGLWAASNSGGGSGRLLNRSTIAGLRMGAAAPVNSKRMLRSGPSVLVVAEPVAREIMHGEDYYLSHATAMEIHGMTTQPQLVVIVSTLKPRRAHACRRARASGASVSVASTSRVGEPTPLSALLDAVAAASSLWLVQPDGARCRT